MNVLCALKNNAIKNIFYLLWWNVLNFPELEMIYLTWNVLDLVENAFLQFLHLKSNFSWKFNLNVAATYLYMTKVEIQIILWSQDFPRYKYNSSLPSFSKVCHHSWTITIYSFLSVFFSNAQHSDWVLKPQRSKTLENL